MNAKRPLPASSSQKNPSPEKNQSQLNRPIRPSWHRVVPAVLIVMLMLGAALFAALGTGNTNKPAKENLAPQTREVSLVLGDMFVEPRTLSITQGDSLKLIVRNNGNVNHDLTFSNGQTIRQLKPGEQDTIDFGVLDASLTAICTLPGHSKAGMKFSIYVTEP